MAGQVFAEKEKKKATVIEKITFRVGNTTYVAEFKNPPKIGTIKPPKGKTPKEANKGFAEMAEKYDVVIYEKGKKKPVEDPSLKVMATAGKVLLRQSMVKSIDVKKLVPIPKMKQ